MFVCSLTSNQLLVSSCSGFNFLVFYFVQHVIFNLNFVILCSGAKWFMMSRYTQNFINILICLYQFGHLLNLSMYKLHVRLNNSYSDDFMLDMCNISIILILVYSSTSVNLQVQSMSDFFQPITDKIRTSYVEIRSALIWFTFFCYHIYA